MKIGQYLLVMGFIAFIFSIGFKSIAAEDRDISELENRPLAQKPEVTINGLITGELPKEYEEYFTDQFTNRDTWVEMFTKSELLLNKTFINNFHITDENFILARPSTGFPQKKLDASAEELNELGNILNQKGTSLYFFPMPAKINETNRLLPWYVPRGSGKKNTEYLLSNLNNEVIGTNVSSIMNEKYSSKEMTDFYFKTDHHWNIKGAFAGLQVMMDVIAEKYPIPKDYSLDNYDFSCVKQSALIGSWNKELQMLVDPAADPVCHYFPNDYSFNDYQVYMGKAEDGVRKEPSEIYASGLKKKLTTFNFHDAYADNYAELNIINPNSSNKLNVLLIKDSYANPIIFPIAHHFHQTTIFDPRYDKKRSVMDMVNENQYDAVIILYNTNNLTGSMYEFEKTAE
ncbi:hypothetical protein LG298_23740 [Cytobacillus firmus]|uniref:DHHW family protein n=1 Tax=Cytobacillus firmus TaxID=1399 RepID=UPI00384F730D